MYLSFSTVFIIEFFTLTSVPWKNDFWVVIINKSSHENEAHIISDIFDFFRLGHYCTNVDHD